MGELENKIKQMEEAEKQLDFLGASIHCKEALQMAQKLGQSEKIKELKSKITTFSKKIDFNHYGYEQHIKPEVLENFIHSIIEESDNLSHILEKIGYHPYLYPKIKEIENRARKTMPITFQIANITTFSTEGHILEGGSDPITNWNAEMYRISQDFITKLYLRGLFESMKKEKELNSENLFSHIEQKKIFSSRSLPLIKKGIEEYFEGDFISALHILIPQFEASFLEISRKLGIDIVALNRGSEVSTRTKVLSETHLASPEFRNVWGEDFCEQLKYVLFDPLGYKLRHKIAHGEIDPNECNENNTELIIYFFLVLASRISTKPKNNKNV